MSKQEKQFIKVGDNYVYLTVDENQKFINFLMEKRTQTYDEYIKENKINLFIELSENEMIVSNKAILHYNCWRQKNNHNYFVSKYKDASHLEAVKELEKFVDYMENIKMKIT